MTTLYLVSNQEYSDGGTLGIFSTEEKAQAFVESFNSQPGLFCTAYTQTYTLNESDLDLVGKIYVSFTINVETVQFTMIKNVIITQQTCFNSYYCATTKHNNIIHFTRIFEPQSNESIEQKAIHIASDTLRSYKIYNYIKRV